MYSFYALPSSKIHFFLFDMYNSLQQLICLLQTYVFLFKNITLSVPGAVVTGIICILLLFLLKFISEKLKDKMKFPLPAELIVVSKNNLS